MMDSIIRTHQSELTIPLFFLDNKLFSFKMPHSHSVVKSRPTNWELFYFAREQLNRFQAGIF